MLPLTIKLGKLKLKTNLLNSNTAILKKQKKPSCFLIKLLFARMMWLFSCRTLFHITQEM